MPDGQRTTDGRMTDAAPCHKLTWPFGPGELITVPLLQCQSRYRTDPCAWSQVYKYKISICFV